VKGNPLPRRLLLAGLSGVAALALAACGGQNPAASTATVFNQADVEFAQNMIPHHRQAMQVAELTTRHAADPQIKQLASQITAAQAPEIQTLTGLLTAWGKVPISGHDLDGMVMPGMLSNADLAKLMSVKGTGFDRMFAQMMITHHNGAIQMTRNEQARGANPDAKALAATIEGAQTAEVSTLRAILDRL